MRIVVAGAGHAGLVALHALRRRPVSPGTEIVVVSDEAGATYSGMMPGWVEGLYEADDLTVPVAPVVKRMGGRLLVDRIEGIDAERQELSLARHGYLPYDACVLNTGASASPPRSDGSALSLSAKPFATFRNSITALWQSVAERDGQALAVVGGGAAGVELACALAARAREEGRRLSITLIEGGPAILGGLPDGLRRRVERCLAERAIAVRTGAAVDGLRNGHLRLDDGSTVPVDAVVWATPAGAPTWLEGSGLALDRRGFVATHTTFASVSHPEVLAVGDIGTVIKSPRPKAGVWSVRSGRPLADQLRRMAARKPLKPVRLQRRALILLALGNRRAVGTRNGLVAEGHWVWRWKDRIDRNFIRSLKRQ